MSREIERLMAEIAEKKGYLRGRIDSVKEQLLADPVLREIVRAREWLRAGADVGQENGRFTGLPDGWPEGSDGDQVVAALVEERLQPLNDDSAPESVEVESEFSRQFRRGIEQ